MTRSRLRAVAALPLLALASAGCGRAECDTANPASPGSCAGVIAIHGVQYVSGRGEGAAVPPSGGRELRATQLSCGACAPAVEVVAHSIPGVRVTDAVIGPGADELMLAERLWQVPRTRLPAALRPYVRP